MHWNSIGILGKPKAVEKSLDVFQTLYHLLNDWNIPFHVENEIGQLLQLPDHFSLPCDLLVKNSDLILVVGGDGSMLSAARLAVQYDKPLIGINRGHLGFLTDIHTNQLKDRLHQVLQGEYWLEERSLLHGKILTGEKIKAEHSALNDIVLSLGTSSQLIEFDLWINDVFVCRQRADGLIVSTPTGSTAYSLSAGGPILHPELDAVVIVPMLPHRLSSRPIVIRNNADIKIILKSKQSTPARANFDSHYVYDVITDDVLQIHPLSKKLKLIHPNHYDYFETLRDKLNWEHR